MLVMGLEMRLIMALYMYMSQVIYVYYIIIACCFCICSLLHLCIRSLSPSPPPLSPSLSFLCFTLSLPLSQTHSNNNQCAITCSSRAASGYLYPLDKGFIFVHKPAVYIKFDAIASVNFARMTGGAGVSKSFDFEVELKDGNVHHFSSMMKYVYKK